MHCCNAKMYFPSDTKAAELDEITGTNNIVLISHSVLAQNKEYHSHHSPPLTCCRGCSAILCIYSILRTREEYYKKMMEEEESQELEDAQKAEREMKDKETDFLKGKYVKDLKEDEEAWICEFCGVHNRLLEEMKVPETEDELFMLKKAITDNKSQEELKTEDQENKEVNLSDDTNLMFCIDVSGSMRDSHSINQDGKATYVTRMKLVIDAVLKQIDQMECTHPNRRIGLVTFDDRITLYDHCPGTRIPVNVKLHDFEKLFRRMYKRLY